MAGKSDAQSEADKPTPQNHDVEAFHGAVSRRLGGDWEVEQSLIPFGPSLSKPLPSVKKERPFDKLRANGTEFAA
ncbi:hypothetical protein SBA_ch1_09000 [Sphingomonas bisphenolicum]|uniref:Uncharacterized protein n=1 Tax=Sphingomonas bisphenolicum TaxID=296544 RepID=A0ABM7FUD0_9SPHN|nr:hypothetical protein SBA_ch1_09000 [Sphingomonas bisphenolicum]